MAPEDNKTSSEGDATTKFVAVNFVYNDESKCLMADLHHVDKDPKLSLSNLQALLKEKNFESFKVSGTMLQELLRRSSKDIIGTINIAEKPVYYDLKFEYSEETKALYATLEETNKEQHITMMFIQEKLREHHYDKYMLNVKALQAIVEQASLKQTGRFEIGKKPEYTKVEFEFDAKTKKLIANVIAAEKDECITLEVLQKYISDNHFSNFYFKDNVLDALLNKIQNNQRGRYEIAQRKDAEVIIKIANDEMSAKMTVMASFGGDGISMELIKKAIKNEGIEYKTCDQSVLDSIVKQQTVQDCVFAKGIKPKDGLDTTFEALCSSTTEHAPVKDDMGKVDFLQVKDFTNVKPGEPLMRRIPASKGVNGCDVLGRSVPAKAGVEKKFSEQCKGVEVDPNDENLLVAVERGYPVILEDGVRVEDILVFDKVDLQTGNINYDGCVLISGKISPGMVIHVTGDVVIKDTINNATIIAGNNIIIDGGVMGSDIKGEVNDKDEGTKHNNYNAHLSAGGFIKANFISRADLVAQGNIEIKEYIAHSIAFSNQKILLGQKGGKGQVIGGKITAKRGIVLNIAGAPASVRTKIVVGYTPEAKKELKELQMEKLQKSDRLKQMLYYLEHNPEQVYAINDNPESLEKFKKFNTDLLALTDRLSLLNNRLYECKLDILNSHQEGIEVKQQVFTNVSFDINNTKRRIENDITGAGTFVFSHDEIKLIVKKS
tara:strand:- start:42637 stop:44790 length:2154 start_codon:yes stop_codon:yes gene_type:complete